MKLNELPTLPLAPSSPRDLYPALTKFMRETAQKVNQIGSGSYSGFDGQSTAAPTTGTWAQGDFIKNSNVSELGAAASKYVILGFICTVGGTPGTWLQCRVLTGN